MFTRKTLGINNRYTFSIVIIVILLYLSYNVNEFFATPSVNVDDEIKKLEKINKTMF